MRKYIKTLLACFSITIIYKLCIYAVINHTTKHQIPSIFSFRNAASIK